MSRTTNGGGFMSPDGKLTGTGKTLVWGAAGLVLLLAAGSFFFKTIPVGHVGVATLFGEPVEQEYRPGLHFPVNPLYGWTEFDIREQTRMEEDVEIPSQDQLTTKMDVSLQWRIDGDEAPRVLDEIGGFDQVVDVLIVPKLRSAVREAGTTVEEAEDFFNDSTRGRLQRELEEKLNAYLNPDGVIVKAVLLRDMQLPQMIRENIERKKQAEQRVEQATAELEQTKVDAQRRVEEAKAEREAAEEEAEKLKLLADARAYEIEAINTAVAQNPAYIQLEALKALQSMSKDDAAKLYFMNSDSPMPLPLMNLGEPLAGTK